jgi:hypothetical protein
MGQVWTNIGNTGIKSTIFKDDWGESVYFRKGSSIIAAPMSSLSDFSTLFQQNKKLFELISDSCLPVYSIILGDSAESLFKKYKVSQVILIEKCEVQMKDGDKELWKLTNKYGPLQPCWQTIYIKRTFINSAQRIKLLSFRRQGCEI